MAITDTGFLAQLQMYHELELIIIFLVQISFNDKNIIGLLVRELGNP